MINKKECEIVKDLFPNYIDNLTSKDTNNFIENHLNKCKDCRLILEEMQENEKLDLEDNEIINFAKKFNKKYNLLKLIVALLVLSCVIVFLRKGIIMANLLNKTNSLANINNYYIEYYQYNDDSITVITSYVKDNKYLRKLKNINKIDGNIIDEMVEQFDGEKCNLYIKSENEYQTYYDVEKNNIMPIALKSYYLSSNIFDFIKNCLFTKIQQVEYNGIIAYKFTNLYNNQMINKNDDNYVYIDKENGLILRASSGVVSTDNTAYNTFIELKYKFNSVTDDDILNVDLK